MRVLFLVLGIILLLTGLGFISIHNSPVIAQRVNMQLVKYVQNSLKITDVPLVKDDKFFVVYTGAAEFFNPSEAEVVVYDPLGNNETINYLERAQNGLTASYTGNYTIELIWVKMGSNFFMQVRKAVPYEQAEYPFVNLLPVGIALSIVGTGLSMWSARSSKHKNVKHRIKRLKAAQNNR